MESSYLFIYLFVHESRAPVTWLSAPAILPVSASVASSSFSGDRFASKFSSQKPTHQDPGCVISAARGRAFTFSKDSAWIFGTCCTTLEGVIALSQANNYRLDPSMRPGLHHWEFESVWKCLKPPESVIRWNRLYCTCILLALLRIHGSTFGRRVSCLPKTCPRSKWQKEVWGSRLNITGQGLALDSFVKTKDILSRFKDHFWSVMLLMFHLYVFYLPILKQVVGQYKMWHDVMFWFSQMFFYT